MEQILVPSGVLLSLALAALDWRAVARRDREARYLTKPAAMIAITFGAVFALFWVRDRWQSTAFLLGFLFSLAGDLFLLSSGDRHFIPGLLSFLLAHVCYIVGLNQVLPPPVALALVIPIGLIGFFLFWRIAASLRQTHPRLLVPVTIYSVVISLMLFSAWATPFKAGWTAPRVVLIILGATLFFISDSLLALNRFVARMRHGDLAVMVTYHLGQIALAASLVFSG